MSCVVRSFTGTCVTGGWVSSTGLGIPCEVREGMPANNSGTQRKCWGNEQQCETQMIILLLIPWWASVVCLCGVRDLSWRTCGVCKSGHSMKMAPFTKALCCGILAARPPDSMQAQSLKISILLTLTCAVIDASVLCVLIKCYYLPLCPEAMRWAWVRLHKSRPDVLCWESIDSSRDVTVIISLQSIEKFWWSHYSWEKASV